MPTPILYIFAGLPGSGKTTLAQMMAREYRLFHLRIDTIEQGLRELCSIDVESEGYRLAYRIAADNLKLGLSVIADSCNPVELTRREWEEVAIDAKAEFSNIEVICSDKTEHRRRVELRESDISGIVLPTWVEVEEREYHEWEVDRIILDTAGSTVDESWLELRARLDLPEV